MGKSKKGVLLARVAVALLVALAVAGLLRFGVSTRELERVWRHIVARPGDAMTFRFILQPAMAGIAALGDGIADPRLDRTPYLSAIVNGAEGRGGLLWEGIASTTRILVLGVVVGVVYQLVFLGEFFPAEAALIAILLAFVPYALLRGPIGRLGASPVVLSRGRRPAD